MRYGVSIGIQLDENAHGGTFTLTRGSAANAPAVAESKAIHMEPSQAGASEEEEDIVAEGDDKRPQRRKRRAGAAGATVTLHSKMAPRLRATDAGSISRRRRRGRRRKKKRRYWPAQRASPALRKRPRLRMAKAIRNSGATAAGAGAAAGVTGKKSLAEPKLRSSPASIYRAWASSLFSISMFIFRRAERLGQASLQSAVQEGKPRWRRNLRLPEARRQPVPEPALPEPAMKAAPQPGPASAAASAAAGPAAEAAPEPAPEAAPEPLR